MDAASVKFPTHSELQKVLKDIVSEKMVDLTLGHLYKFRDKFTNYWTAILWLIFSCKTEFIE
ncbi:hypothetical protein [Microbulbifer sp. JTAC008]|uniref:hypothetical protein n=1 Tax=unclassified Microbulbifer TaxID=2619833 RepID=UPI00403929A8